MTFFTFPVSEISPIKRDFLESFLLFFDEMILAASAKSIPGSQTLSPRDIFAYTSWLSSFTCVYFPSTAMMRSSLLERIHRLERFGYQNLV